jgi:uncharacterized protein YkwD
VRAIVEIVRIMMAHTVRTVHGAASVAAALLLAACGSSQSGPQAQTHAFADPDPGSDTDPGSEPDPRSAAPDPDPGDPRWEGGGGGGESGGGGDTRIAPPDEGGGGGGGGGNDGSIAQQYVAAHNAYRKQHCAAPLEWSAELAKAAQSWADQLKKAGCAFEHSRTRYGENLAGGTSGALDPAGSTEMWYREVDQYDFKKGGFSMATGHFTQVVWAGTKRVGCGMTTCKGMDIIVCNYDPPGNVQGGYAANVKPKGCK